MKNTRKFRWYTVVDSYGENDLDEILIEEVDGEDVRITAAVDIQYDKVIECTWFINGFLDGIRSCGVNTEVEIIETEDAEIY